MLCFEATLSGTWACCFGEAGGEDGEPVSTSPRLGVQVCALISIQVLDGEFRSSCLHSKHLTHTAIPKPLNVY